jgi:hypothetical protein
LHLIAFKDLETAMCAQRAVVATRGATGRIMRAGATHWEATAAFILVNVSHNVECERMFCFFRVSQGLPRRWEEWEESEEEEEEEEEGGREGEEPVLLSIPYWSRPRVVTTEGGPSCDRATVRYQYDRYGRTGSGRDRRPWRP